MCGRKILFHTVSDSLFSGFMVYVHGSVNVALLIVCLDLQQQHNAVIGVWLCGFRRGLELCSPGLLFQSFDCEEWGSLGAVIPIKKAPLHIVNMQLKGGVVSCCLLFYTERPCINGDPSIPALPRDDNVNSS